MKWVAVTFVAATHSREVALASRSVLDKLGE